jgi:hypothetical protein
MKTRKMKLAWVMKKSVTTAFVFIAGMVLPSSVSGQFQTSEMANPLVQSLPCCACLGKDIQTDLNTGHGSLTDVLWTVNGGAAYITPPVPGAWITLPPAKWLQPVATPTPSSNVSSGPFRYEMQFKIPDACFIPFTTVEISGTLAADNDAKLFLDNNTLPSASCTNCFNPGIPFNLSGLSPGTHKLKIDVQNQAGSSSGLIVNAKLTGHCRK